MIAAIAKARQWSERAAGAGVPRTGARDSGRTAAYVPSIFRPPPGGFAHINASHSWRHLGAYRTWTYIAVQAWIRQIAGGDPPLFGRLRRRQTAKSFARARSKTLGSAPAAHQEFIPYPDDHPIVKVFTNPNGPDVAYDLWAWTTQFYRLTGSAHWWVRRDARRMPVEIWPIPTHWIRLVTRGGDPVAWTVQSPWAGAVDLPIDEVVSFWDHSPINRWEGMPTSHAISDWLDAYDASTKARVAQYANGAIPSYHLSLGESYGEPTDEMLERYYTKLDARLRGPHLTNRPLITGPDVRVTALGISPVEMRYIENEEQAATMILAAHGVPKAVVGMSDSMTYGSLRAALASFFVFAVNPVLTYFGQVITEKVVKATPGCEDGVCFWRERVMDDPDQLEREMAADMADGTLTPNEKRAMRGRPPYPHGGNDPLIGGHIVPWQTGDKDTYALDREVAAMLNGEGGRDMVGGRPPPWE